MVQENRPLVSGNHRFASLQFLPHSRPLLSVVFMPSDGTHSLFDQSKPAGQSKAPVRSWWNPRSALTLRASGGLRGWPRGVIQSKTAPFKLLVSSALAPEEPFWIYAADFQLGSLKSGMAAPSQRCVIRPPLSHSSSVPPSQASCEELVCICGVPFVP